MAASSQSQQTSRVVSLFRGRLLRNRYFQAGGIAALVFVIYLATSELSTPYDHFVRLADAFLHGRLYLVDAPEWLELARFGDKGFVISPPGPTLFVLPFVLVWGLGTNQAVISMLVGSAAAGLFWVATTQLGWRLSFRLGATALFALGTNLWWAASTGSVWSFAHVSAVFFLTAALVETTGRKRPWVTGILVGLAGLSRLPTFLSFPFFGYMLARGEGDRKSIIRRLAVFGAVLAAMGGLYLLYTYGEYGTLSLGYEKGQFLSDPWFSKGLFSLSYVPRQLNTMLFAVPVLSDKAPFFTPSTMGLGLFFTTPALIYMFRSRLGDRINAAALCGLLLVLVPILTYGATGWTQFGYRFSLDFLPFMMILVASGMRYRLDGLKVAAIVLSCGVNLWGVLMIDRGVM